MVVGVVGHGQATERGVNAGVVDVELDQLERGQPGLQNGEARAEREVGDV